MWLLICNGKLKKDEDRFRTACLVFSQDEIVHRVARSTAMNFIAVDLAHSHSLHPNVEPIFFSSYISIIFLLQRSVEIRYTLINALQTLANTFTSLLAVNILIISINF